MIKLLRKALYLLTKYQERKLIMRSYICDVCGYIYDPAEGDPDNGVEAGTAFDDIPEDWICPLCGVGKEDFSPVD